jgi:TolB-like protein/tetratricopeptide (TPR) repeat protein
LTGTSSQGGITPTMVLPVSLRASRRRLWIAGGVLAVVIAGLAIGWQFWRGPAPGAPSSGAAAPAVAATGIPDLRTDPSIAVLPFKNMSSDAEQEFFSDGISEELLNLLAKVPKLRVVARTSSFAYKDKGVGIQQIGRELNVASVLEGSVRKSGDKVRITVQLVRASDGTHLWSQTYDRTLEDIFAVQDEIAANVVEKLKLTLMGAAPTVRPVDPKVYPLLLQAKAVADQNTTTSRAAALSIYQRVVAIAPEEPRAHAGMARLYLNQAVQLDRPAAHALADARKAIARTLELDPDNATARSYLARMAADFDGDLVTAARETQRVLELDPGAIGMGSAGGFLMSIGRSAEAIPLLRSRAESDPANPVAWGNLQIALGLADMCDEAIDAGRQVLTLSPDYAEVHSSIATCLLRAGKTKEALAEARLEPFEPSRLSTLAIVQNAMGDTRSARALRDKLAAGHPVDGAIYLAAADTRLGDHDAAFRWLEQAIRQKDAALALIANDWTFEPLHADPRWHAFLRRINRAPEQLAAVQFKVPPLK